MESRRSAVAYCGLWVGASIGFISGCNFGDSGKNKAEKIAGDWVQANIDQLANVATSAVPLASSAIAPILASVLRDGPTWKFNATKVDGTKEWDVEIHANARVDFKSIGIQRVAVLHGEGKAVVDIKRKLVVRGEVNVFKFSARME